MSLFIYLFIFIYFYHSKNEEELERNYDMLQRELRTFLEMEGKSGRFCNPFLTIKPQFLGIAALKKSRSFEEL